MADEPRNDDKQSPPTLEDLKQGKKIEGKKQERRSMDAPEYDESRFKGGEDKENGKNKNKEIPDEAVEQYSGPPKRGARGNDKVQKVLGAIRDGDLNEDGKVDKIDVVQAFDVNGDGKLGKREVNAFVRTATENKDIEKALGGREQAADMLREIQELLKKNGVKHGIQLGELETLGDAEQKSVPRQQPSKEEGAKR